MIKPLMELIIEEGLMDDEFLSRIFSKIKIIKEVNINEKTTAKELARQEKQIEKEERRKASIQFAIEKQKALLAARIENQKIMFRAKAKMKEELVKENIEKANYEKTKNHLYDQFKGFIEKAIINEARKLPIFSSGIMLNDHNKYDLDMFQKMYDVIDPKPYIAEQLLTIRDNWFYYVQTRNKEQEDYINTLKKERHES
jgi:hypothetical protein